MRFHCPNGLVELSPVATGGFGGVSPPQTNLHASRVEVLNTLLQISWVCQILKCQVPLHTDVKPPYWRLSSDDSGGTAYFRNLEGALVSNALCRQQCFFFTRASFQTRRKTVGQGKQYKSWGKRKLIKISKSLPVFLFLFSNKIDLKIITEMIENHSEFSYCANSCNKFFSIRSWQTIKLPTIL